MRRWSGAARWVATTPDPACPRGFWTRDDDIRDADMLLPPGERQALLCLSVAALARGVAVGEALQYADEATLSSSLLNRLPYKG